MKNISKDELNKVSMNVIINAGSAKDKIVNSFKLIADKKFSEAENELALAKKDLTNAHKIQTGMLQKEAEGVELPNSVLFNHAQDTLMTTKTEQLIAVSLITIFKQL